MNQHPALVKGLNLDDRLAKMNGKFVDATGKSTSNVLDYNLYFETDYTRFDLSISQHYIAVVEKMFLCTPFAGDSLYLQAMSMAITTIGISDIGFVYHVNGTRCSGDAHTSIGNGLINHFNTWLCLSNMPVGSWCSYHEGDDGLICTYQEYRDQVSYNLHLMPCLGFQLKIDVFNDISQTSFCGRFLGECSGKLISTCDVIRSLSKLHTICSDGDAKSLLVAKMISYYHSDSDTPFVGTLASVLIQIYLPQISHRQLQRAVDHLKRDWWFRTKNSWVDFYRESYPYVQPSAEKRALCWLRTGFSIGMQCRFESYYLSWLMLGYVPRRIDKIYGEWFDKPGTHVFGRVDEWVV